MKSAAGGMSSAHRAVWNQHEVLYVIKPTNLYTLARDAIRDSVAITYNAQAH